MTFILYPKGGFQLIIFDEQKKTLFETFGREVRSPTQD